jgi:hypothetical protein
MEMTHLERQRARESEEHDIGDKTAAHPRLKYRIAYKGAPHH